MKAGKIPSINKTKKYDYITRMKAERKKRDLRQGDIARVLGINESMISRVERGVLVPTPYHQEILEKYFGLPWDVLAEPAEHR